MSSAASRIRSLRTLAAPLVPVVAMAFGFISPVHAQGPYDATPQRPTFTSDTSTTAPGTIEIEFGGAVTGSAGGALVLPTAIKFTPDVGSGLFRRTELSIAFDSLQYDGGGDGETSFGDTLTLVARRPVWSGTSLSIAIAPQASFFLRDGSGARVGVTGLAAYAFGPNAVVANLAWTVATESSASNPARDYSLALDYARTLDEGGRWGAFAGVLASNPSNADTAVSLAQGVTWRARPDWVLDIAIVEEGLREGDSTIQVLFGFTVNLGRPRDW